MNPQLQVGMRGPAALGVTITAADPSLDMTTVTGVTLTMRRSNRTTASLYCSISLATTTSLLATHIFIAGDLPVSGPYQFDPVLVVPSGIIPGTTINLFVAPAFGFNDPLQ
jgi:hypothetical protein